MPESHASLLRRAARQMRTDAKVYRPASQDEGLRLTTAALLETVADDMGDEDVVERGVAGAGVLVLGRLFAPRKPWTAAIAAARAYFGEA